VQFVLLIPTVGHSRGNWTTRGLADAAKRTKTKHGKSPVTSASCLVRDLSSTRVGNPVIIMVGRE